MAPKLNALSQPHQALLSPPYQYNLVPIVARILDATLDMFARVI